MERINDIDERMNARIFIAMDTAKKDEIWTFLISLVRSNYSFQ